MDDKTIDGRGINADSCSREFNFGNEMGRIHARTVQHIGAVCSREPESHPALDQKSAQYPEPADGKCVSFQVSRMPGLAYGNTYERQPGAMFRLSEKLQCN